MNAPVTTSMEMPLCVDLDGTLLRGDMLHECVLDLVRRDPLTVLPALVRLLDGKAAFKSYLAKVANIEVADLPYNEAVLTLIEQARAKGRTIVLVTATHERWAHAVADHLGIFDEVLATNASRNLRSHAKAHVLTERFGLTGFEYVGDSRDDVAVWNAASRAVVVGDGRTARRYARDSANAWPLHETTRYRLSTWSKALRLHQWLKNSLLFVPLVLSAQVLDAASWSALCVAFVAFGLCASGVYLINDVLDMPTDRKHRTKSARPIPAGLVTVPDALLAALLCSSSAILLATTLPVTFSLVLAVYFASTLLYSFVLKRKMLVDTLALAGLFTLRIFAGAAALGLSVSTWLLGFSVFFFLSLALVKRYVELAAHDLPTGKLAGRGYRAEDLPMLSQAGLSSGFAAVVVLALFIDQAETREAYANPDLVWLVCPLVLYMITRIWMLARRAEMNDDPVVFIMTDWRSQLMVAAGAAVLLVAKLA